MVMRQRSKGRSRGDRMRRGRHMAKATRDKGATGQRAMKAQHMAKGGRDKDDVRQGGRVAKGGHNKGDATESTRGRGVHWEKGSQ
jgi:hypothetical protein